MQVIVDLEANGLLVQEGDKPEADKIWCVVVKSVDGSFEGAKVFVPEEYLFSINATTPFPEDTTFARMEEFLPFSKQVTHWVGHNIIHYDMPMLEKFGLTEHIPIKDMTDTMILSQITQPNRAGGHSLKAWGLRFEEFKDEWEDFSEFSWDMVSYCLQDIVVTEKLFDFMQDNVKGFSSFSIRIEHQMRSILDKMQQNGFYVDLERAHKLYVEIKNICDSYEGQIQEDFPPRNVYYKKLYPRKTAKGDMHAQDRKTLQKALHDVCTDEFGKTYYHLYTVEYFNPRSTPQVVQRMEEVGWKPVVFNDPTQRKIKEAKEQGIPDYAIKGTPKVVEENFETLPETAPESAKNIAKWFFLDKRLQKLDEWFRETNPSTGCIHGRVFSCGAHTHRMTHRNPNMANISKVKTKKIIDEETGQETEVLVWGEEGNYATDMRACFTTRDVEKEDSLVLIYQASN
jgi:DNA polymerase-1